MLEEKKPAEVPVVVKKAKADDKKTPEEEPKPETFRIPDASAPQVNKNAGLRKIARVQDVIVTNRQIIDKFKFWCKKIKKNGLNIEGRGTNLKYSEI